MGISPLAVIDHKVLGDIGNARAAAAGRKGRAGVGASVGVVSARMRHLCVLAAFDGPLRQGALYGWRMESNSPTDAKAGYVA